MSAAGIQVAQDGSSPHKLSFTLRVASAAQTQSGLVNGRKPWGGLGVGWGWRSRARLRPPGSLPLSPRAVTAAVTVALAAPAAANRAGHRGAGGAAAPAVSPSARRGRRRRREISIVTEDARGAERGRAGALSLPQPPARASRSVQLGTPRPGAPHSARTQR